MTLEFTAGELHLWCDISAAERGFLSVGTLILPPTPGRIDTSHKASHTATEEAQTLPVVSIKGPPSSQSARRTMSLGEAATMVSRSLGELTVHPCNCRGVLEALLVRLGWAKMGTDPASRSDGQALLLTPKGIKAGVGRNHTRRQAYTFIVLTEGADTVMADRLDWPGIVASIAGANRKKDRAAIVMRDHAWLPIGEQAKLAGYSARGWLKFRKASQSLCH